MPGGEVAKHAPVTILRSSRACVTKQRSRIRDKSNVKYGPRIFGRCQKSLARIEIRVTLADLSPTNKSADNLIHHMLSVKLKAE
jgi:hypothetical protein